MQNCQGNQIRDRATPSPIEVIEPRPVRFESVAVWCGPDHITVPLLGVEDAYGGDGEMASCSACGAPVVYGTERCTTCGAYLLFSEAGVSIDPAKPTLPTVLQQVRGANPDGTPISNAQLADEMADVAAQGHTHRLFNTIAFAEAPAWILYLPKPGSYSQLAQAGQLFASEVRHHHHHAWWLEYEKPLID